MESSSCASSSSSKAMAPELAHLSLVVLMGLPASGKSTLANHLLQKNQDTCNQTSSKFSACVVSFDTFVPLNIQAKMCEEKATSPLPILNSGKIVRKKFLLCVDTVVKFSLNRVPKLENHVTSYLKSLQNLLSSVDSSTNEFLSDESLLEKTKVILTTINFFQEDDKVVIIVDDNNYYSSMRNDFYQIAKTNEIGFFMIYCSAPLKTCVDRNSQRNVDTRVPHKAIVEMSLKFEPPDPLENPCDVYCVSVDMTGFDQVNFQLLQQLISTSFSNPLRKNHDRSGEVERARRICSESEVHQADLHLRKWISKKLTLSSFTCPETLGKKGGAHTSSEFRKNLGKELTQRKKTTLDLLKTGQLQISFEVHQDVEFREEIIGFFEKLEI